jgi:uncharacterized coiled-coil DUF342 family protein
MEEKTKFFQVNVQKVEINEVFLDPNSSYYEYAKPWTFKNEKDATEYLRQRLNKKLKKLDEQLNELVEERKQLVNTILTL